MKKILCLLVIISIFSCKDNKSNQNIPVEPNNGSGKGAVPPKVLSFSENIEEAHNKPAFMTKEAVAFDIDLKFGDKTRLDAKVSMLTNSSKVRLDKTNETSIVYNGEKVFISPDSSDVQGARFDIFTWQYFFAMPFKLTDPGTVWTEPKELKLDSLKYETSKLSFKNDIGDSPDDWYVVYKDDKTSRLKAAAYIVTFSQEQKKAEQNPHAIVYSEYKVVDQIAIATKWSFHNWDNENGLGEKLGEASISNIHFFKPEDTFFKAPENALEVKK
ncbi:hypothetical protein [Christiangramia salexigens]|uniref:Heat-shock protein Hsp90 n=1 Tax=Christiangramia salexigens TaxID=1913577 RepID=A0A1L3J4H8_9FLAO|nr:hypothetical protein [Christiangramia salexigens]APG60038.1 hypothetical protein LPB144_06225 [Christiangramia salexigens]